MITCLAAITACQAVPVSPASEGPTPAGSPEPLPEATDTAQPERELAPIPARPLDTQGPWAVFTGADGLYAINLDGSGQTLLMSLPPYLKLSAVAPQGGRFSIISAEDTNGTVNLTLHILRLPDGVVEASLPLTGPLTEPGPQHQPGDAIYETMTVLGSGDWSPDGQQLAFEGGMDSDNADLYLYNSTDATVTRLTSGPSNDFSPRWSPDGKYIVHMGASTFGSGAGYEMSGVWLSNARDGTISDLYLLDPKSGAETILGWADAKTVIVYSFTASCSTYNLRSVDIETGEVIPLWPGYFNQLDIAFDPASGTTLLFSGDLSSCEGGSDTRGGYLVSRTGEVQRISDLEGSFPVWNTDLNAFVYTDPQLAYAIRPDGSTPQYPPDLSDHPAVSPDGRQFVWREPFDGGLYGQIDSEFRWLLAGEVQLSRSDGFGVSFSLPPIALWSADSRSFLFAADGLLLASRVENDFMHQTITEIASSETPFLLFKVNP